MSVFFKGKKRIAVIMAAVVTLMNAAPVFGAESAPSLNVNARSAVLMEPSSGIALLEQNPHDKFPPASVTKIMTLLLIYESVERGKIKWDDVVTVSDHAASMGGSQIFLEPLEQQTVRDLTKSVVVASANDAAVALAEFIAGSEDGFVLMMNNKAKELDMNNTNFINACGLDTDGHMTSAYDIALMTRELITKYPTIYDYSKIWMDTITHKTARGESEFGLSNTNKLIKAYNGATGLKTGSTSQALFCISATANRDGMDLVSVIMGAPDSKTRFHEAVKMLDYGFANFSLMKGDEAGKIIDAIKVIKGNVEIVDVSVKSQVSCIVPKGKAGTLEGKAELLDALNAPAAKGSKAGEIVYYFEGEEVGRSDLVTCEEVEKARFGDTMKRVIKDWLKH
ncbi:MAG: D-alanyl-D-alanine carboxypeptidase [Clostridiales bacterium]|jgi:D-alanyl-D-alanine carboxypeptidase (penicillin-binding protein 5/6)|nr:D-alanyl-D-alanine carboxypeptidase [Clostridiales bacterium]